MTRKEKIEFLAEFGSLENSEIVEHWSSLSVALEGAYYGTDEYQLAVMKEVDLTIQQINQDFNVIEETITKNYIVRRLEYIG